MGEKSWDSDRASRGWRGSDSDLGSDSDVVELIVKKIAEAVHPQRIILFGSWARGEHDVHSDIDLLVVQDSDLPRPQRYAQVRRLFWGMGIPMDILVYTPEEFARFQSVPGSFTHTVAREGKVLYERERA